MYNRDELLALINRAMDYTDPDELKKILTNLADKLTKPPSDPMAFMAAVASNAYASATWARPSAYPDITKGLKSTLDSLYSTLFTNSETISIAQDRLLAEKDEEGNIRLYLLLGKFTKEGNFS